jgi:hypothetical protein
LEEDRVQVLRALHSLQSKENLSVERRLKTHCLRKKQKEKWIKYDVEGETTVPRQRVQVAETAITHEQNEMRNVEKA